jgi:putative membrane protein
VKLRTLAGALIGAALLVWLLAAAGLGAVATAITHLGLAGFAGVVASQLGLSVLMGWAWQRLGAGRPDARLGRFIWARLVRDAVAQALPFTQVGGVVLGARALTLEGVAGDFATAASLTDMAVEFASQIVFVAIGAAALTLLRPGAALDRPILVILVALVLMAGALVVAQMRGAAVIERLVRRVTGAQNTEGPPPVAAAFAQIRRRPLALAGAFALHLTAWLLAVGQTWLVLALLGTHASLAGALVIDSLTAGAKAVGFMVPASLGVQEGALVVLGALFGVSAPAALALSLVRRGRDLVLAIPVLVAWQATRGERIWNLREAPQVRDHLPGQ